MQEHELERALLDELKNFFLELGSGFALVGQQYRIAVSGRDHSIDLLFYQLRLRCFIVIDLKVEESTPEFSGKMNFYLSAVDDLLRHEQDNPTIGLIFCKDHNKLVVEYALRGSRRPMGAARYILTRDLPPELRESLPSPASLRKRLAGTKLS